MKLQMGRWGSWNKIANSQFKKVTGVRAQRQTQQKKPLEFRKYYQDKYQLTLCVHIIYIMPTAIKAQKCVDW